MTKAMPYTCKFCKKPGFVQVDEEYAALRDPYGLLNMASCNRCADYRVSRRGIFRKTKMLCELLVQGIIPAADKPKVKESLETLVQRYMRLYADHYDLAMPDFDPAIVEAMMWKPAEFSGVLGRIPKLFQQKALL